MKKVIAMLVLLFCSLPAQAQELSSGRTPEQQYGVVPDTDPRVVWVAGIAADVVAVQNFPIDKLTVLGQGEGPNAFCIYDKRASEGQRTRIYVSIELVDLVLNCNQPADRDGYMAMVLGHELTHAKRDHADKGLPFRLPGLFLAIATRSMLAGTAGEMAIANPKQRDFEYQADLGGVETLYLLHQQYPETYSMDQAVGMMQLLQDATGNAHMPGCFMDHPGGVARIARIHKEIDDYEHGRAKGQK